MESTRLLTARLVDLLRCERAAMAEFLIALAGFDRERRWEALGYTSLFYFLHRELGLSKSQAFYRKTAAELLQRHPDVIEPLRDGRLCLSSVVELAKVVDRRSLDDVLPRFFHCSKDEARAVAAELCPSEATPRREVVTRVGAAGRAAVMSALQFAPVGPAPGQSREAPVHPERVNLVLPEEPAARVGGVAAGALATAPETGVPARIAAPHVEPAGAAPPAGAPTRARDAVEPLTADLRRFHLTVTRDFLDKLQAAKDALSHARPDASTEDVLDAALDLLLADRARKQGLAVKARKPRAAPESAGGRADRAGMAPSECAGGLLAPRERGDPSSDHVPAEVKRFVWKRDGGCCQWRFESGAICGSRRRVQVDHVVPRAQGGPSTVENLRLLCQPHNLLAARRVLGEEWMEQFTAS